MFKDTIEKDNKFDIKITPSLFDFTQHIHKIEATLRNKQCEMAGCGNVASIIIKKNGELVPICDSTLTHSANKYYLEDINSTVSNKKKMV